MAKKKKKKPVEEEIDDTPEAEDEESGDDYGEEVDEESLRKPTPTNDAYVGMTAITFVCLAAACGLLYLDFGDMSGQQLSAPQVNPPALGGAAEKN